jgi:hypothetical protein
LPVVETCSWWKASLLCGAAFAVLGVTFVAISLFTDVPRTAWQVLNQSKGLLGFGLCGFTGAWLSVRGCTVGRAALAGGLGGLCAGVLVPVSMYTLAYGFIDHVVQYPFEYHSMVHSGARTAQEYLCSATGSETVRETSLGLVPLVAVWAAVQGAVLGAVGAWAGRWLRRHRPTVI